MEQAQPTVKSQTDQLYAFTASKKECVENSQRCSSWVPIRTTDIGGECWSYTHLDVWWWAVCSLGYDNKERCDNDGLIELRRMKANKEQQYQQQ